MKILELPKFQYLIELPILTKVYNPSATNIILNIINNKEINTITVPAFICEEIHLTFLSSKKLIKYYDIDMNFQPKLNEAHLTSDCLLLCEFFGMPLIKNEKLISFIKNPNKTIIFDRCHSLFSGTESKKNIDMFIRKNIFFVYSLRKFFPTINGAIICFHEESKSISLENIISSKKSKNKAYFSTYLKKILQNNYFFQYALKKRLEYNLSKKSNLLAYKVQKPKFSYHNLDYLNYFNGSLDKDIFKWLEISKFSKIEKNRKNIMESIYQFFLKHEKFKIAKENKIFKNYGIPYGVLIDIGNLYSKEIIEFELVRPLLSVVKDVDIILWPYNTLDQYKIFGIKLKSKLLILPRIKT